MSTEEKKTSLKFGEFDVLVVIGAFLGVFGIAVIVAIFFTNTYQGKITNLICGSLLILISVFALIKSKFNKKKK